MAIRRFPDLAVLVLSLAIVGCDLGGISREKAIEIATNGDPTSALSAEHGPLGRFDLGALPEEPRTREVRAVRISGRFPFSCPYRPNMTKCPADATTKLVVLDFRTGESLFSEAPAP
jgi:hypothetical protein